MHQYGDKSLFVENNSGTIYIDGYSTEAEDAFSDGSFELEMYHPSIRPHIDRNEVSDIAAWIEKDSDEKNPIRVGLLYGKPGIGKSVVMHDLLSRIKEKKDYLVLGLKSDQVEFADVDHLSKKLHLAMPLDVVVRQKSTKYRRVVLLIDQIDALSLTLSSNRTPLRSLLKLIQKIQIISNVRIVLSCRPYDLEYDPILEQLKSKKKWELKEFSSDKVKGILEANGCPIETDEDLLHFLGNPLHLSLFLKIEDKSRLRYPLTEEDLYDELWRVFINDVDVSKVNRDRLLMLLNAIANQMYNQQELSVRVKLYETEYLSEINYLLHSELIRKTSSGLIQFFHQSMFDYVFARRFVESGCNLLEELKGKHQGLFVRASVKSIMSFLRSSNPKEYINNLLHILSDKDNNGAYVFRYHIRSLVLSSMVFFEKPIKEELDFVNYRLLTEKEHMNIMLEAVHNIDWFSALLDLLLHKYGWNSLSDNYKDKLAFIGRRVYWSNPDVVLDFALTILDNESNGDKQRVANMLNAWEIDGTNKKLIEVYNRITTTRNPLSNCYILKNLVSKYPEFVIKELTENIRIQLANHEDFCLDKVKIGHYEQMIYDELEKKHPEIMIDFYLSLIELIYEKDAVLPDGFEIKLSYSLVHFERDKGTFHTYNFNDSLINKVIDNIIKDIDSGKKHHATLLHRLIDTKLDVNVCIALCCYAKMPLLFVNDIYDILCHHTVLFNAPSWVEYYAAELLRVSYAYFNHAQKVEIVNIIKSIDDRSEKKHIGKIELSKRLEYGIPILRIDKRKGVLLSILPEDEVKKINYDAYRELLRIKRKFKPAFLRNEQPSKMSTMSGWPAMSTEKAEKMSDKAWKKSMLAYTTDSNYDWNTPSLSGQQMVLQQQVSKDPEGKFSLLMDAVTDDSILLSYPIYGMRGLLDAKRFDLAEKLFCSIVEAIGVNINGNNRNFNLHSFLFAIDEFIKAPKMPQCVFDFLCRALREAEEDLSYRGRNEKDIYNRGINLPRGNAAYKIVECCKFREYIPMIFNVLEEVAEDSSEFTRAAILFNLAVLNKYDRKRNVSLFLKLMHDYHPLLMAMPIHNYNPLVYFVNYALDELHDFFNHALEIESCYEQQVIILWLAWNHTHKDFAKDILDEMCERNEEARLALVGFLYHYSDKMDKDVVEYLCRFMREEYASDKMSEQCDEIFYNLEKVDDCFRFDIASCFVDSVPWQSKFHCFYGFLAGYAAKDPLQTLIWLNVIVNKQMPEEFDDINVVTDVLIQSYNGIKQFDDKSTLKTLELAMDLLDKLMQLPESKYALTDFLNKLDND